MRALLQMYLDDPTVDVDAKFELYWLQPQEGSDALADFLVQAVAAPQMLADLAAANAGLLQPLRWDGGQEATRGLSADTPVGTRLTIEVRHYAQGGGSTLAGLLWGQKWHKRRQPDVEAAVPAAGPADSPTLGTRAIGMRQSFSAGENAFGAWLAAARLRTRAVPEDVDSLCAAVGMQVRRTAATVARDLGGAQDLGPPGCYRAVANAYDRMVIVLVEPQRGVSTDMEMVEPIAGDSKKDASDAIVLARRRDGTHQAVAATDAQEPATPDFRSQFGLGADELAGNPHVTARVMYTTTCQLDHLRVVDSDDGGGVVPTAPAEMLVGSVRLQRNSVSRSFTHAELADSGNRSFDDLIVRLVRCLGERPDLNDVVVEVSRHAEVNLGVPQAPVWTLASVKKQIRAALQVGRLMGKFVAPIELAEFNRGQRARAEAFFSKARAGMPPDWLVRQAAARAAKAEEPADTLAAVAFTGVAAAMYTRGPVASVAAVAAMAALNAPSAAAAGGAERIGQAGEASAGSRPADLVHSHVFELVKLENKISKLCNTVGRHFREEGWEEARHGIISQCQSLLDSKPLEYGLHNLAQINLNVTEFLSSQDASAATAECIRRFNAANRTAATATWNQTRVYQERVFLAGQWYRPAQVAHTFEAMSAEDATDWIASCIDSAKEAAEAYMQTRSEPFPLTHEQILDNFQQLASVKRANFTATDNKDPVADMVRHVQSLSHVAWNTSFTNPTLGATFAKWAANFDSAVQQEVHNVTQMLGVIGLHRALAGSFDADEMAAWDTLRDRNASLPAWEGEVEEPVFAGSSNHDAEFQATYTWMVRVPQLSERVRERARAMPGGFDDLKALRGLLAEFEATLKDKRKTKSTEQQIRQRMDEASAERYGEARNTLINAFVPKNIPRDAGQGPVFAPDTAFSLYTTAARVADTVANTTQAGAQAVRDKIEWEVWQWAANEAQRWLDAFNGMAGWLKSVVFAVLATTAACASLRIVLGMLCDFQDLGATYQRNLDRYINNVSDYRPDVAAEKRRLKNKWLRDLAGFGMKWGWVPIVVGYSIAPYVRELVVAEAQLSSDMPASEATEEAVQSAVQLFPSRRQEVAAVQQAYDAVVVQDGDEGAANLQMLSMNTIHEEMLEQALHVAYDLRDTVSVDDISGGHLAALRRLVDTPQAKEALRIFDSNAVEKLTSAFAGHLRSKYNIPSDDDDDVWMTEPRLHSLVQTRVSNIGGLTSTLKEHLDDYADTGESTRSQLRDDIDAARKGLRMTIHVWMQRRDIMKRVLQRETGGQEGEEGWGQFFSRGMIQSITGGSEKPRIEFNANTLSLLPKEALVYQASANVDERYQSNEWAQVSMGVAALMTYMGGGAAQTILGHIIQAQVEHDFPPRPRREPQPDTGPRTAPLRLAAGPFRSNVEVRVTQ